MNFLTQDAVIVCDHPTGLVQITPSQQWVTIAGRAVLVQDDPENRPIVGCPNCATPMKPCMKTQAVREGYSAFVRIGKKPVCLGNVSGLTDGMPAGAPRYRVRGAGQGYVGAGS